MIRLRGIVILAALLMTPLAAAQDNATADPTVAPSDFDTEPPAADTSYMDCTSDPTLAQSDFDMSEPTPDTSYLDDGSGAAATSAPTPAQRVPIPGVALLLAAGALSALLARRRS